MRHITLLILLCFSLVCAYGANPKKQAKRSPVKTIERTEKSGIYTQKFRCLASDTSVRHGTYQLIYKGDVIEKGDYRKGERVGVWEFYNLLKTIEFRYDYDSHTPFNILPHVGETYTPRTFPSIFLGSPYVPYHYISLRIAYPTKEQGNTTDCRVVLGLNISAQGRMTGYHLVEESRPTFNEAVLKAAAQIPKHWRWIPARRDGKNVPSVYKIILIFEAVE